MQRLTYFADVIVPLGVPNKYTYRVPLEMNEYIQVGKRVLVPFGKSKIHTGIVYQVHEKAPKDYEVKYIEAILDDQAIVTNLQLKFWDWISFYYCANPGEVMNAALPSGLKLSSTSHIQLNAEFNFEETNHAFFTEREHQIIDALHATPNLELEQVAQVLGVKSAQPLIKKLLDKKAIVIYEDVKDKYRPKLVSFIRLNETYNNEKQLSELLTTLEKKAFKQAEALLFYLHLQKLNATLSFNWVKKSELLKKCETSSIAALVKKNVFKEESFEVGRLLFEKSNSAAKGLSYEQQQALNETKNAFNLNKPVLLQGVTGSGKTELYISLIKEALEQNKQVLYLIPEIGLTTQLITRLRSVFGELVGVYHSRFSENERVEIWNNVLKQTSDTVKPIPVEEPAHNENPKEVTTQSDDTSDGSSEDFNPAKKHSYKIILGARSSVFLPFAQLGLIIVDEEHDSSFKQHDPSPRYHARDAALYLATLHQAKVILGSATPSVESFYNASQGKYQLVSIHKQFVAGGGSTVELCDVSHYEKTNQMKASLTPPLFEGIQQALTKKEQVILFQNRRGFAPYTECKQCGHVPHCVQCDVSLIYHKHQQKLVCHYCGYSISPPKTCTACGSNQLHYKGMGTEKVEEEIEILFPTAKIARMDLDSTRSKYAYKQLIDDFEEGIIDILIGTQMVTKGLDFNNVGVVGVLNADSVLNFPDFRSFEKSFQLITQVKGRAGRSHKTGSVFIQTSQPEHKILEYITKGQSELFFSETLTERRQFHYPPFTRLFEINVISKDVNEVNHLANELFALLKISFGDNLLGPEFPMVSKIKNQYYKRILIKSPRQQPAGLIREQIFTAINELQANFKTWRYKVSVDVDPV